MDLIKPPYLVKGDTVAIVATARKVSELEIKPAVEILVKWGLNVVLGKNLFNSNHQFAGTDEDRAADLQLMLNDKIIKAVIIARGGYGTVRIIDKINFSEFKKNPKWIVGYSDITVLHSHVHTLGVETIHGTMPLNFTKNKQATESLHNVLFGKKTSYEIKTDKLNVKGNASGQLVGGNLSIIYSILGSKSNIDTKGKILFIEDLDEYLYHIDRMMMALKRAGKLSKLSGLIVGGMTDMKDNRTPFGKNAEQIILDAVKEYNYPVCFNFPAGHTDKNLALILGRKIKLEIKNKTTISFF